MQVLEKLEKENLQCYKAYYCTLPTLGKSSFLSREKLAYWNLPTVRPQNAYQPYHGPGERSAQPTEGGRAGRNSGPKHRTSFTSLLGPHRTCGGVGNATT